MSQLTAAQLLDLGLKSKDENKLDDAADLLEKSIALGPNSPAAHDALSLIYIRQGRAVESFDEASASLALAKNQRVGSNRCLVSNYHPALDGEDVLRIHRQWDEDYGEGALTRAPKHPPHTNDRDPDRKLRIGYVSPDFKGHPVYTFFSPVLRHHDRSAFEIYCYANVNRPDALTAQAHALADQWRDIRGQSTDDAERMIREDKIDILVDLAGHTSDGPIELFARKAAPVQASMIGYPCTTGLRAIDYKITDKHCDPPGAEKFYSEKLVRLAGSFWCFSPLDDNKPAGELPAKANRAITFGSVNNCAKMTDVVIDLWARIVAAVPRSRLRMQHQAFASRRARQRIYDAFRQHGVGADRIALTEYGTFADYLNLIRTFDIALDPFPFNGGTTTCHLFYYGVPIVALAGQRQVSRMGVSMLNSVGLPELIANSKDDYLKQAVALAKDVDRLAKIRAELRDRMLASPLCDQKSYTDNLRRAFRDMWQTWCAGQ